MRVVNFLGLMRKFILDPCSFQFKLNLSAKLYSFKQFPGIVLFFQHFFEKYYRFVFRKM
jgi:hypothetical protein